MLGKTCLRIQLKLHKKLLSCKLSKLRVEQLLKVPHHQLDLLCMIRLLQIQQQLLLLLHLQHPLQTLTLPLPTAKLKETAVPKMEHNLRVYMAKL